MCLYAKCKILSIARVQVLLLYINYLTILLRPCLDWEPEIYHTGDRRMIYSIVNIVPPPANEDYGSILCMNSKEGDKDIVQRLLAYGVRPTSMDENWLTALHWSCQNGH